MPSISQIERHYDIHYEHIINCSKRIDVEKDVLNSRSAFLAPRRGCSAAVLECAIGSDGSIYPCRMLMYEEMRSRETLVKKDFNSIWYTDDVLRRIREETQVPESCYQCPYSRLCAGECPAHRVNDNGQIMHSVPIPYCTIYKQVISRKIQVNLKYAE
jgi:radical SAM protein with 4Fe4S-binding SPASM domain